ncbi:protein cholesin isoform 2-T3 [Glossophaga mutica]
MYDGDQVPEEHFPALLAYLEGLRGRARELTLQKAEALMRELDQAGADTQDPPLRAKTQRVRQVLQLLS